MASITEWVEGVYKNVKNKPTERIRKELFDRIISTLSDDSEAFDECVTAFCRFDAKIIEPFYEEHYWSFSEEWQTRWNRAMITWANNKKPTDSATIRIIAIMTNKLSHAESANDVMDELKWLSVHEDKKTSGCIVNLRDKGNSKDLQKLLSLDMNSWSIGQVMIDKIFSILFAGNKDPMISEMYREFLYRNHLAKTEEPVSKPEDTVLSTANEAPARTEVNETVEKTEKPKQVSIPLQDGEKLAEALLSWARTSKKTNMEQAVQISDQKLTIKKLTEENESLSKTIDELENAVYISKREKATIEAQLTEANSDIATLQEEKAEAEDTIGRVQVMSGNSVKQELDGFKHALSAELKKTVQDFYSDMSDLTDADKVEIYKALLEELLDTLRHHDIAVEEE